MREVFMKITPDKPRTATDPIIIIIPVISAALDPDAAPEEKAHTDKYWDNTTCIHLIIYYHEHVYTCI